MSVPESSGIGAPKDGRGKTGLESGHGDHYIVVGEPRKRGAALGHHGGGDERRDSGAGAVCAVENAKQLVGALQVADPGVPGAVLEAVSEAREEQDDGEDRVGGVEGYYDKADQTTQRSENCHAALAVVMVDEVAGESRAKIAYKGGEEEQRDDGILNTVVGFDLPC